MSNLPILSLALFWPLLGALLMVLIANVHWARRVAVIISVIELGITAIAVALFDANEGGFQLNEDLAWIPSLNVHYQLGIDGISVLFLPMTALLTLMALMASWNNIPRLPRLHLALLLALQSVTIGVLTALDMALFFLFWELTLPPLFFLIGLWGIGVRRREAAMKYTLFMLFGGVPLLFAIILLASNHALQHGGNMAQLSFSLPVLLNTAIPSELQQLIFLLLLLGFAVKAPLLPLHTWLPTTATEAPAHISALLVGLKLGVYGILRFAIPLAPQAALEHRWLLAIVGTLTLIGGALLALQQSNLRRLLAFSSISHVGLVLVGIAAFNLQGVQGAVFQLLNFSIVASSLMLIAGMLQQRLGGTEQLQMGGLAKPLPRLTALLFLFGLSSIGVPGSNGFPAELLMLFGIFQAYPALALVALLGAVLGAAYWLGFVRKAFLGPIVHAAVAQLDDIRPRELALLAIPALLVLALGCYPQWLLAEQETTLIAWLQRLQQPGLLLTGAQQPVPVAALIYAAEGSL